MNKTLAHPELIRLANAMYIADVDYNDMSGSDRAYEFANQCRAAQKAFRDRREELEAAGATIWSEEKP